MSKKLVFISGAVISLLGSLYFLMLTVQTAWLGSFPGRDVEAFSRWAYMQLGASIVFFVVAILFFRKGVQAGKKT